MKNLLNELKTNADKCRAMLTAGSDRFTVRQLRKMLADYEALIDELEAGA